jgi:hypothetical protein
VLVGLELGVDAGDALVDDCDGFHPGFEYLGGVTRVEIAWMGFSGCISALRLFEFSFEVGEPFFQVFFAHALRLHGECECS